jgi:hypothetical protein
MMGRLDDVIFGKETPSAQELVSALLEEREDMLNEIERLRRRAAKSRQWAVAWKYYAWIQKRLRKMAEEDFIRTRAELEVERVRRGVG